MQVIYEADTLYRGQNAVLSSTLRRRSTGLYSVVLKRLLDLALVILTAPVTVPLIAVLAVIVRMEGGPAFYRQGRLAADGRYFTIWKLRTMVPDADARLSTYLEVNPEARKEWQETQKLKNDPRITAFGRFLRRTSADELPQLWNVLVGDMSLVGPRPMMPQQRELYPGELYAGMRPGLTGLWQVSDRNSGTFAGRAQFDLTYASSVSLTTDFRVLMMTVTVVCKGTGW